MFKKRTAKRHLALFVALALSSGTLLTAAPADAADVSGNDLKIDAEHPTVPSAHQVDTDSAAGGAINGNSDSGQVKENTLTLTEHFFAGSLYGGYTRGSGNVEHNKIFVHNKAANLVQGHVFGGLAKGVGGNAKHNTVTLTGGTFSQNIYGGSSFNGDATHNTVNLGDGKKTFDGVIHGTIYGGDGADSTRDHRTGNTLNVNTNVVADNIKNFSTINFNYNSTVSAGSMLHLNDDTGNGTRVDWNGIHLTGTPEQSLTLMSHANGMQIDNYAAGSIKQLTLTDTHEAFIRAEDQVGTDKYQTIRYNRNQFKGVTKSVATNGSENVYGGFSSIGNTTTDNHVTITGTTTPGSVNVYGGYTEGDGTTAEATKRYDSVGNTVTMAGGTVDNIYGGYTSTTVGKADGNTVTVKAGRVTGNIYGGKSEQGDATNNTVNLGDGKSAYTAMIDGTIFGGSGAGTKDQTTGNTLNVNANAEAYNIKNFSTINFNFNTHTDTTRSLLTLTDSSKTKLDSLNQLYVKNAKVGKGTLMWNSNGFEITDATKVGRTEEKTETIIEKATDSTKITYRTYQFKGSRDKDTETPAPLPPPAPPPKDNVWGGRSVLGNTTTDNEITLSGEYNNVYGGWTTGTGSTATGADAKNHSIDNKITLEGSTSEVYHMTGGSTNVAGGKATGNKAILTAGTVAGNLAGGSARDGEVSGNRVEINNGRVNGTTYGGTTGGSGKAEDNIVTLKNGIADGDIFGGVASNGAAVKNIVNINGGSATNDDVFGGWSTSGDATGNTVNLTASGKRHIYGGTTTNGNATGNTVNIAGGTATDVFGGKTTNGDATGNIVNVKGNGGTIANIYGGRSEQGSATGNTVNLGDGSDAFTTGITGTIYGGGGTNGAKDYFTGNTLNVKGNVNAANISNFAEINFYFNSHVNQSDSFLTLSDAGGTTIHSLSDLKMHGEHGHKGTLLKNTGGTITISEGGDRLVKTDGNKELVLAKSSNSKRIDYEGYQFKDATNTTTVEDGANKDIFGGRSIGANTTTRNIITVSDAQTYRNVYGGWTTGSGTTATDKNDSTSNEVTVNGSASVTGTVYGGFTDVAGGKATGNKVTVEKNLTANIVGGKATAEASSNTVNLANATVNSVTGGDGATTNNNIVNLNGGANVTGDVKGGTQANGTGNTLNVKGVNSAGTISNFQKLHFDTTGATATNPLLNITGGATNLDWNTLDASGTSVNRVSLLKNTAGINLSNHTPGTVKSKINEAGTTEYNIDVAKTGSTVTDITYQGYQFKGKTTATTEGTDTYGGRSKAGNTTTENDLTLDSGSHTNIYGGWASGAGSTADAAKQKNSIGNKATVKGAATATGAVIGGLTDVAGGKATGNTVTVEKDLAANIIGGKAASGEASGNTVNLANATVNSVTGGDGTTTNDNTVNLNGSAQVTGALKGGSQASGTGNTLNVKGKNNKAGSIENIQKMNFDATGLAKDDTMLEDTNAAGTNVNWANLKASGTAAKPLTLLKNANGINLTGYTGAAKSETGETTETNIDVRKTGSTVTEITYEGYQFKGVTQATTVTEGAVTDTFGGRSKAGNSTRENEIAVASGTHTNVYGGWTTGSGTTAADKGASYKNTVTVKGSANVTNTLYGGYTEAAGGKATENTVTVEKDLATANIIGGKAAAEASNNTVNLSNATVNSVTGGEGATTNNNIVNLKGNAQVTGALKGGSAANGTGNTLNVTGTNNKAGSISGFQKLTFDTTNTDANPMLQVTGGATTDVDWTTLTATGAASETPKTLMENAAGINISGRTGDAVKSELNTDATIETNIDVVKSGSTVTKLVYEGYTFKGSTKTTTYGADTWAGRSKAGNTTQDNTLTLDDASKSYTNVYGGWTSGTGTKAAADKQNNSLNNTVNYMAGTLTGTLYGGHAAAGEASGNTVNLGDIQTAANIYGGFGSVTKNNTINLKGARVTGTVYGGSAANGTGNTLAVYKPSEVQDFAGVQNLHFHTDELTAGNTTPLLKLGTTTKDIRGLNIGVDRRGDAPKLKKGDKLLLMKTGGDLTTDDKIENKIEGKQGMARRYTYEIKKENNGELTATVTQAGLGDDAKSPVETRAGLSNLINQGADYIVESGIAAAETTLRADAGAGKSGKGAQRNTAVADNASYHLWAGVGANSMRVESGSHVDSKGWSLGVGWAREDAMKDGAKRLFSPFVEYGRGSYDSYLDNGTHGSGAISYLGIGVLGKLTQQDGLWLEGSVRGGRATSDYQLHGSSAADYDGSNTYYGIHLGIGKTVELKKDAAIDAYARYFWSHQNGMSVKLSSGDNYDFAAVDSHRLRLGFRYSQKDQHKGEFYTGLAWEYEFGGEARATIGGDAAPSPSLKGSSYMLELGYRFSPENSRVSYDLHLNGWQGKRKGLSGGAAVKWAF